MRSRVLFGITLSAVVLAAAPAQAQWCALDMSGASNCYYTTQAQCRAALSGLGGSCINKGPQRPEAAERPPRPERAEPRRREPPPQRAERPAKPATPKPEPAAASPATPPPTPAPVAAPAAPVAPTAAAAAAPAGGMAANFAAARQLVLSGQYQAGIAALQALGFDDHPDIATYIGFANNKLGRPEQARVWYDRAYAANPNHLLTLSFDGMLLAERGNVRGAQERLERLRTLCGGTCNEYQALEAVLAAKR